MNNDEFLKKLSEVADWKVPENEQETSANAKKKRGKKSAEELYQEAHEDIFNEIYGHKNPTKPPLLLKIKYKETQCEDCGEMCPNGRIKQRKQYATNRPHFRSRCVTCDKHEDPETGELVLESADATIKWAAWLRKTSSKPYHMKTNLDDAETIINYQESKDIDK